MERALAYSEVYEILNLIEKEYKEIKYLLNYCK